MYTLNVESKKLLTRSITSNSKQDMNDKELFLMAYKEYKSVPKSNRQDVTKEFKLHIETKVESVNIQSAVLRIIRVAYKYVDMQVIANFDKLEYANIKALVNLFSYIDKNISHKSKEVRDIIKSLHEDNMSISRYNNLVVDKVRELRAIYKVVETVEGNMVTVSYSSIVKSVDGLSIEDKQRLVDMLSVELSSEVA